MAPHKTCHSGETFQGRHNWKRDGHGNLCSTDTFFQGFQPPPTLWCPAEEEKKISLFYKNPSTAFSGHIVISCRTHWEALTTKWTSMLWQGRGALKASILIWEPFFSLIFLSQLVWRFPGCREARVIITCTHNDQSKQHVACLAVTLSMQQVFITSWWPSEGNGCGSLTFCAGRLAGLEQDWKCHLCLPLGFGHSRSILHWFMQKWNVQDFKWNQKWTTRMKGDVFTAWFKDLNSAPKPCIKGY